MVKKRKTRTRRASPFRVFKRKAKRRSSSKKDNMLQIDSMLYGAVRSKMSDLLAPLTSRIPLGVVADEVGVGIFDYFVTTNTSGLISDVAKKGLTIENARLGEAIADGSLINSVTRKTETNNFQRTII